MPAHCGRLGWPAAVMVALLLGVLSPTVAAAHDQLVAAEPAADSSWDSPPSQIRLTFSDQPQELGLAVIVSGSDGVDHVTSIVIDGRDVVAHLEELADDGYLVRWRVVSSDGHPISGVIPFTVGDGAPSPGPVASAMPESSGETPTTTAAPVAEPTSPLLRAVLVALGGAVGGFALYLLSHATRRRIAAIRHRNGSTT